MNIWRQLIVCMAVLLLCPLVAHAGSWPQAPGATQIIASYEPARATHSYDGAGHLGGLGQWRQNTLSLFADHGVTKHFTLTAKLNIQDYHIQNMKFSGLGSVEVGGRWTFLHTARSVFALGASVEGLGKGHRDEFDTAQHQGTDYDLRAYYGHSFRLGSSEAFVDIQAARHLRQYNPDQWRVDATFGVKPSSKLMLMAQVFAGQTSANKADRQAGVRTQWTQAQLSVVRNISAKTAIQIGYRQMIAGRNVPQTRTLIVSLWRNF